MAYPSLALHTLTTKPWSIFECIDQYTRRGIGGISVWCETVADHDPAEVRKALDDSPLSRISYVRGGFFTGDTAAQRAKACDTNRRIIDEAKALGMPSVVLVCGATPGQSPRTNLSQIRDGIASVLPHAEAQEIDLLIEPLHPIYCGDKSGVPTLAVANDLCEELDHPRLRIAVDTYHAWWDPSLEAELARCTQNDSLAAYHICDFKPDQSDMLLDRGIMGEGCANLQEIDQWVVGDNGFTGFREVEIFSVTWWQRDQNDFLDHILQAVDAIYPKDTPS